MADATLRMLITSVWKSEGIDKAKDDVDGLGKKTKETSTGIGASLSNLSMLAGGAALAAGAAATKFAADSVKAFNSFEKGMAEVFTLMPNASGAAMTKMSADVRKFAVEAGRLPEEVVPALYQAISAGVPADNVFDFLEVSSNAALGGVTSLETAVDGISSVVNAYGVDVLGAGKASDLMFTAVKLGKTTFDELANSLYNVVPTASALGLEFGNVTAALAAMTAQGTPTSVATTQLRQLLVELSQEGSKANLVFQQMAGMGFREFIAQGGNLQDALKLMEQAAGQSGVGLNDLFSSVEAGSAALTLTGKGTAAFTNALNEMDGALGATETAAATMGETTTQKMAEMQATLNEFKLTVGEELTPAVTELVLVFTDLAGMALPWVKQEMEKLGEIASSTAAGIRVLTQSGAEIEAIGSGVAGVVEDSALTATEKLAILNNALDASGMRGRMAGYSSEIEKGMVDVVKNVVAGAKNYDEAVALMEQAGFDMERSTSEGWGLLSMAWGEIEQQAADMAVSVAESFDNFKRATIRPDTTAVNLNSWESQMLLALRSTGGAVDLLTSKMEGGERGFDRYGQSAINAEGAVGRLTSALGGSVASLSKKEEAQKELEGKVEQTTAAIEAQEAALASYVTNSTSAFKDSGRLFDDLYAAQAELEAFEGSGMASVYQRDQAALEELKANALAANAAIVDSYKMTAFEALLAQTGVNETTLAYGVGMGLMTQAEADARLEFTNTTLALSELASAHSFVTLSTRDQLDATQLLILGYADSAEEAAAMAGQVSGPLSTALAGATELTDDLRQKLDMVTGQKTADVQVNVHGLDALREAVSLAGNIQQVGQGAAKVGGTLIEARASGGPVGAGRPYLVGEEGPEMIMPKQDGYVLNARETAALGGGGGSFNMSIGDIVINSSTGNPQEIAAAVNQAMQEQRDEALRLAKAMGMS